MAMTLEPCPFCGNRDVEIHHGASNITFLLCGDDVGRGGCGAVVSFRPNLKGSAAVHYYNRRAHLSQPAQAMDVGLVERLRKRAAEERQIAENNARVAELLAPELARFKAGEEHNVYATRMAIDHRDSAKRDAAFADDLEMAASALAGEKAEGWRDIATAPNDGTVVLLAIEKPGYSGMALAYQKDGQWHSEESDAAFGGWTHWMPLPASPTPDKEG